MLSKCMEDQNCTTAERNTAETDRENLLLIFRELSEGKRSALESAYNAFSKKLYGLALWRTGSPEDAGDIVQEVFIRLVEKRDQLSGVKDPLAWLLKVTHRAAVDFLRKSKRRNAGSLDDHPYLQSSGSAPDRTVDARRVSALVDRLKPAQREVVYLRHFEGCTFSDIGTILGIPTFTAASRYRNAIKKLGKLLETER